MIRHLFLLTCFWVFSLPAVQAQSLRNSPREDTFYHFYPLDSALLSLYYKEKMNRDSIIFLRNQPVLIGKSNLNQAEKLLGPGTYLRVHASDLFIEREVFTFLPFTLSYIADGQELIFFAKDIKTKVLWKDLRFYYQDKAVLFNPGKGGYVLSWEKQKEEQPLLLIRDRQADYAYALSLTGKKETPPGYHPHSGPEMQPAAGYMLLSKPKYKPGDTVKAYTYQITGQNGRPVRKKIQVSVSNGEKMFWHRKVKKQKPGSYHISFPIPDSFLLDRNYNMNISYRKNNRNRSISKDFAYEDYTLDKATYDFFLDKAQYKAGDSLTYYISAKDENGFAQPFGQYTLDITVSNISLIRKDTFSIHTGKPLYHKSGNLSGEGLETHVLPPVAFPPGKSQLRMTFKLVNELNEEKVFTRDFEYDNTAYEFSFRQERDSILAEYLYLRKSTAKRLRYQVRNYLGDTIKTEWVTTPARIPVRLDYSSIRFFDDTIPLQTLQVEQSLAQQLNLQARQTKDSAWISFRSNGDRTVYYTILKNKRVLLSDSGLTLNFSAPSSLSDQFEFTLSRESTDGVNAHYNHWYLYPERKKLKLSNNLPEKVLPGETVDMTVSVRDYEGKPRKNIDLSNYAIKNQFKEENGTHRFYFFPAHRDTLFAQLADPPFIVSNPVVLRYSSRKPMRTEEISKLGLHRYAFYQFYFPQGSFFEENMPLNIPETKNNTAQLSIQLIQNGRISSPVWIKADGRPIYYALSTKRNVAALPSGKHHIQLQTADKILDLGTLLFLPGQKKILSVNVDSLSGRSRSLIARDSVRALHLDSLTAESILNHSNLSFSMPSREARLVFEHMTLYYTYRDYPNAATSFIGNQYQFFGPYYDTRAKMFYGSDSVDIPIGSHNIHFFNNQGEQLKTLVIPKVQWPATAMPLSFEQVFDTLYYPPVPAIPYQGSNISNNPAAPARPEVSPLFGDYLPQSDGDSLVHYNVFDPSLRLMSLAVVQRDDIEKSWFKSAHTDNVHYNYFIPRSGNADLFFQLTDGSCITYKNVSLRGITHFYVNTDSLKPDSTRKNDLVFYQNVYSSLTSTFKQLFTNFPERISATFESIQKGRKSSMIQGRLINSGYDLENVYLENAGRFVSGTMIDANGNFQFLDVAAGTYMIKIHPAGSKPVYVYNLNIRKGEQYNLGIQVLEEEHPILLSAVNPHFELRVREQQEAGQIRLFDRDQKDLITEGSILFLHEADTLLRIKSTNNPFSFPVQQWPNGLPVSMLVMVPGYESLWVKHFPAQQEFQYQWRFFLQKKIRTEEKENSIFINGSEIARYAPSYIINRLPQDSVVKGPGTSSPVVRLFFMNHKNDDSLEAIQVNIYKTHRFIRSISTTVRDLNRTEFQLDKGIYTIELFSRKFQTQQIELSATQSVRYDIHLLSLYYKEKVAPLESTLQDEPVVGRDKERSEKKEVSVSAMRTVTTSYLKRAPATNIVDMESLSQNVYEMRAAPLQIGGARTEGTTYMIDGQVFTPGSDPVSGRIAKGKALDAPTREEAEAMKANPQMQKLRNTFSDEAAYAPGIRTNKQGNAFFRLHFPDDITLWDLHQVALGRGYFFGEDVQQLRAFKPVTTSIRTPRYLYLGDSLELGYSFRNLLDDPKNASWTAKAGDQVLLTHTGMLNKGLQDSAYFRASIPGTIAFYTQIRTADSFIDQELRSIPVKEKVILSHSDTGFGIQDTSFIVRHQPDEAVTIRINHNLAEYLAMVAKQLEAYPYSCLEQKCSKLKGLICQERMAKRIGQSFGRQRLVRNLIAEIEKGQNSDGSFAWWHGPGDMEMTQIALEALVTAKEAGYIEKGSAMARNYLWNQLRYAPADRLVDIMGTLLNTKSDIQSYRNFFDNITIGDMRHPFDELVYLRIKAYYTDTFDRTKIWGLMQQLDQQTLLPATGTRFTRDAPVLLLRAFRLFQGTSLEPEFRNYMQQYIDAGKHTHAQNTYEQSLVLENFYDFTLRKEEKSKSFYTINGGKPQRTFPRQLEAVDSAVRIRYKGSKAWVTIDRTRKLYNPSVKDSFFNMKTSIETKGEQTVQLNINQDYQLKVAVFNYLPYEHVMITVPLPAGIALKHKIPYQAGIEHIEYYSDRVILYCSSFPAGQHDFVLPVRAAFKGKCTWAPARAELMYRPEVYGHNSFKGLDIR